MRRQNERRRPSRANLPEKGSSCSPSGRSPVALSCRFVVESWPAVGLWYLECLKGCVWLHCDIAKRGSRPGNGVMKNAVPRHSDLFVLCRHKTAATIEVNGTLGPKGFEGSFFCTCPGRLAVRIRDFHSRERSSILRRGAIRCLKWLRTAGHQTEVCSRGVTDCTSGYEPLGPGSNPGGSTIAPCGEKQARMEEVHRDNAAYIRGRRLLSNQRASEEEDSRPRRASNAAIESSTAKRTSSRSWAGMISVHAVRDAGFKKCCMKQKRYDGALRNHYFRT